MLVESTYGDRNHAPSKEDIEELATVVSDTASRGGMVLIPAFAVDRTEVVLEGTLASDPNSPSAEWREYEFKCKPGNVTRAPCLISPYHYRLDWLMWFAAFQSYQHNPWLVHLAGKMLENDPVVDSLLAENPFHGGKPPRFTS